MASDFVTGFYFRLSFVDNPGTADAAFQEVSGLTKEMQVEEVVCGGENRFKYRLPNGTTFPNLVLKRGVIAGGSPLLTWCKKTLGGGLSLPITTQNVQVVLLNEKGQTCMSWTFYKAYPVKWAASDLNSEKNEILIETIELAYQYFE